MKRLAVLWLILGLSACGFHLRGAVNFPPWFSTVAVIANNTAHGLVQTIESRLEGYKIKVLTDSNAAPYWLIIEDTMKKEQITAVSSTTIPRQYQLSYKVRYKLIAAKNGKILVPSSTVSSTRQLTVNNDRMLGSDNEESLLYDEMRDDAVMQMISQLSHTLSRNAQ